MFLYLIHHPSDGQVGKVFIYFRGQGARMALEVQMFEYILKDQGGKTIGEYTSTAEPPTQGDIIYLSNIPGWEAAQVLGTTMLLSRHDNTVVLKVRPVEG